MPVISLPGLSDPMSAMTYLLGSGVFAVLRRPVLIEGVVGPAMRRKDYAEHQLL
jgi:hypothetical protein